VKVLAIIPARGGSKSIPRKNIIDFLGKPLIYWTITAALRVKQIDRVIVSTEDAEIAEIARESGAEVPFIRPEELAEDGTLDYPVIRHCLDNLSSDEEYEPDMIAIMRATSPVRPEGLVSDAIAKFRSMEEADSLRVVCEAPITPYKMWSLEGEYMVPLVNSTIEDQTNQPRQQLPIAYWQIGILDLVWRRSLNEYENIVGKRVVPYIVSRDLISDIDDQASLERAEEVFRSVMFS